MPNNKVQRPRRARAWRRQRYENTYAACNERARKCGKRPITRNAGERVSSRACVRVLKKREKPHGRGLKPCREHGTRAATEDPEDQPRGIDPRWGCEAVYGVALSADSMKEASRKEKTLYTCVVSD
jgi:hypothetical protein